MFTSHLCCGWSACGVDSQHLCDEVVKDGVFGVALGDLVVPVDDGQLGRVLKGMLVEAEQVEEAAQGPDVRGHVHGVVGPSVHHLGRPVHRCRVSCHLLLKVVPLRHRPANKQEGTILMGFKI